MPVRFPALDGYDLGGTLIVHPDKRDLKIAALISCGGGILAARYTRFARYLAANGVAVLTYDYRGIGLSRPAKLRGFRAVAEDWSEHDCGGAIAYLKSTFPGIEIVAISHSIGALITGGAANIGEVKRFIFICPHTGYYRDYLPKYRVPMAMLWHGVMPLVTRVLGYFPAKFLGLGEDIPAGVALQWAARRTPDLQPEATAIDARRARTMIARYPSVAGTVLAIGIADDAFATTAGIRRLLLVFPGLLAELRMFSPRECGMNAIGHFGYFRRSAEDAMWPAALDFLRPISPPSMLTDGHASRHVSTC
jgi:predicted alpha/beta hydrolase